MRTRPADTAATVVARTFTVHGQRGRVRLVLLVRCPFCTSMHLHGAGLAFSEGKRTAGCRQGRYIVRAGVAREAA